MNIDIRTVAIILGITSVLQVFAFLLQYLVNKTYRGIGWWALGYALAAVGFVLLLLRDVVSVPLISIILPNVLLVLGSITIYIGTTRFFGKKGYGGVVLSIFAAFLLSFFYYTYVNNDITARTSIVTAASAIISFMTAFSLFRNRIRSVYASIYFTSAVFFAFCCFSAFRAFVTLTLFPVSSLFTPSLMQASGLLVPLALGILSTFGLIVMVNQRSNEEMKEAKEQFEVIFNTSPDASIIARLNDGVIVNVNEALTNFYGFSRNDVIGKSSLDIGMWVNPSDCQRVVDELKEKGYLRNLELPFQNGSCNQIIGMMSAKIINLMGIPHVLSVTRDVTERKHMEEALRKSEGRLRRFFDSGVVGVVYWNLEGSITDANDRFLDMVGYTREELGAGRVKWSEMTPPEYHMHDEYALHELATTGIDTAYEKEFVRKDGSRIPIIIGAAMLKDNPKDGIAFVLDITARKRAEVELRKAHEKLFGSLESITDGFLSLDGEWRFTYFNKTGAMMVGMKREEIIDKMLWDIFPHAVNMKFFTEYHRAVATNTPVHFEEFYPEPLNRWFECHGYPSPEGLSVYFRDITESRRAEEALKSSEEKYRHLVKHAPTGIYEVDFVNKRLKSVNDVMCQVLGYTEEELLRMDPLDLLDEEGKRTLLERIMKSLAGEKVDETVEYGVVAKDGRKIWTVLNNAFTYEGGRVTGALVVAYDINERKKAEETLRTNEAQLAKLNQIMAGILEHTHMLAVLLDSQFNFIWVNRAYAAESRHEPSFFPGKNHFDLYPNEENKLIFQRVVDTGAPFFVAAKSFEDPDQRERSMTYWDWSLVPVKDGAGRVSNLVFTLTEVTERIRAEEALRKAHNQLELRVKERTAELERKNQELQEFAFVASHDLAEPLRKIQTFGDLLKAKSADHLYEQERDYVSRMSGAARRMQELLDALLRYSRIETQGRDPVPLKLEDIVQTVKTDLEVAIKKIGAHVEIGALPVINGDPYQWRQVFQNLIANAVKYYRSEVNTVVRVYGEENSGAAHIFVEDNGIGFDEKYLDKIFQPFQRLHGKNEYPGTGIGLAICKKIVERHGGTITAKSTPGKGSTFIITLPMDGTKAINKSK